MNQVGGVVDVVCYVVYNIWGVLQDIHGLLVVAMESSFISHVNLGVSMTKIGIFPNPINLFI